MLYCIDSQAFVWAIKKQAEPDQQFRLEQASRIMQWIDDSKHQLIIPTLVLAECLIREPVENHATIMGKVYNSFQIVDFDSRAAMKYGELLRLENWTQALNIAKENNVRRQKMKIDHAIISCALVNGANGIFSDDKDIINFAKGVIPVHSMSSIPKQMEITDGEK